MKGLSPDPVDAPSRRGGNRPRALAIGRIRQAGRGRDCRPVTFLPWAEHERSRKSNWCEIGRI